jgi:4-amino-4-deoxy-L-arabinose transferase-like glycosyltransferase
MIFENTIVKITSQIKILVSCITSKARNKILFSILYSAIIWVAYFIALKPSDDVFFGGDTWEYQSMAVNFSKGHGIQRIGAMEPFEVYKFDSSDPEYLKIFYKNPGDYNFYRTPFFPIFLGCFYKIFGVAPFTFKLLQLSILVLIATSLIWIGFRYYKKIGFVSGLFAGIFFINSSYTYAGMILTEVTIIASLFLVFILYNYWREKHSLFISVLLGVALGISLLVKGSLIFIPLLIVFFELYQLLQSKKQFMRLVSLVVVLLFFVGTIIPWSIYASKKSSSRIILSTQDSNILLDNNNEFCTNGKWHQEWKSNPSSYYNRHPELLKTPSWAVVQFYSSHPKDFFVIMWRKYLTSFAPIGWFWMILIIPILCVFDRLNPNSFKLLFFLKIIFLTFFVIAAVLTHQTNFFDLFFKLIFILFLLSVLFGGLRYLKNHITVVTFVLFLNFFFIALIASSDDYGGHRSRIMMPVEFAINLSGVYCLLSYIYNSISKTLNSKQVDKI